MAQKMARGEPSRWCVTRGRKEYRGLPPGRRGCVGLEDASLTIFIVRRESMFRKLTLGLLVGGILPPPVATGAFAGGNPNGPGQPSQSCGSATASTSPNGFNTAGFATA